MDGSGSVWTSSSQLYIGYSGAGSLTVSDGGRVTSSTGYLGYNAGATGRVWVDGSGSSWTVSGDLYLGSSGTGTLNITNGGLVTVTGSTTINAASTINFGSSGGTLTTGLLLAGPSQVSGTGTISTRGLITDSNLVFDAAHGAGATVVWMRPQQNVTVTLDLSSGGGTLGIGYQSAGTLTLWDGAVVGCRAGYLGYNAGSSGTATVDGAASVWSLSDFLYVGNSGTGVLNIRRGGSVSVTRLSGFLGALTGAVGIATVDGAGSRWSNAEWLYVGANGKGTLTITNGGTVTAAKALINKASLLGMSVGDASSLNLGTGTLTNDGLIRLKTVPGAAVGTYTPIVAGKWLGSGTVTAVGGQWNSTTHVFTVVAPAGGVAGHAVGIDTSLAQGGGDYGWDGQ